MPGPRLCASLSGRSLAELTRALSGSAAADLVELRLDTLDSPEKLGADALGSLLDSAGAPALVTCRPIWEGGGYAGSEQMRQDLLGRALDAGAILVDVELDAAWVGRALARWPGRVLVSHHWQAPGAEDLQERVARLIELRPAVAKLVQPAILASDAIPLLEAGVRLREAGIPAACFCLGSAGSASRLLAAAHGDALVYAAAGGTGTAPGQWGVEYLREVLLMGRWRAGQRRYAVIGDPVQRSLSPNVFNAAFAHLACDAVYVPLPSAHLRAVLDLAEHAGAAGLSVTMPFKEAVVSCCTEVTATARRMGSVNTMTRTEAGWCGDNTDGIAVVEALRTACDLDGAQVVMIGAGGAARAAAVALHAAGSRLTILNRDRERARGLAALVNGTAGTLAEFGAAGCDVLVNATPAGMTATDQPPISTTRLKGSEVVMDMVYRPVETQLLRQARERGCTVVSGLEMFLRQAAHQFRAWMGIDAPVDVMRAAALQGLRRGAPDPTRSVADD